MAPRSEAVSSGQGTFFDARFLGLYAGPIISDPTVALVELVANAWDAYATKVEITWPDRDRGTIFEILDNGIGMTPDEFEQRWRTIYYDRSIRQGLTVSAPDDLPNYPLRRVYGRNGKGRTAGFRFSPSYRVRTWRDGTEATFMVKQGLIDPIDPQLESKREKVKGHGTHISGVEIGHVFMSAEHARSALSTRFLADPAFSVSVNGILVTFDDVPTKCLAEMDVVVPDFGVAHIRAIDTQTSDRTTKQHGIAWWVNRRLVGHIGWRGSDQEKVVDGRTEEAKRFTFIVQADFLEDSVEADWSDFKPDSVAWNVTQPLVQAAVREKFGIFTAARRAETGAAVRATYREQYEKMPLVSRARWSRFLDQVVEACPGVGERQLSQLMGILANLEVSQSQYAFLDKLHALQPGDFDSLNSVMETWTVQSLQIALDVVRDRLLLIEEIRARASDPNSDEVQQLQPLFKRGLWVFGPQFEAMEYTSNQPITSVIKKLFKGKVGGSQNRPDFAITPDSTVGCYYLPSWDENFNEDGVSNLVIVELKRPGIPIGEEQTNQVMKYIRELRVLGHLTAATTVTGFVLGDSIAKYDDEPVNRGLVTIRPMLYATFLQQAQKRMLTLHDKLINTPMMQGAIAEFSKVPDPPRQARLPVQRPRRTNKPVILPGSAPSSVRSPSP